MKVEIKLSEDQIKDLIAETVRETMRADRQKLLTGRDAAKLLGISVPTLWNYRKAGVVKAIQLSENSVPKYAYDDLMAVINTRAKK